MGRRRRATPYFHPSSSLARVAAFLLVFSRRHTPTNHRQPLSSLCLFLRSPLPRSSVVLPPFEASDGFPFAPPSFPSSLRLSMLECSMLQYITYTLLPVHLFPSFFFSPPILFSPETAAVFFSFYSRTDIASSSSTLPPSFVVAPSRVVFAARSSLHRGRHGNARSAATGKFLRLSIFGKLPLSPRAPF